MNNCLFLSHPCRKCCSYRNKKLIILTHCASHLILKFVTNHRFSYQTRNRTLIEKSFTKIVIIFWISALEWRIEFKQPIWSCLNVGNHVSRFINYNYSLKIWFKPLKIYFKLWLINSYSWKWRHWLWRF